MFSSIKIDRFFELSNLINYSIVLFFLTNFFSRDISNIFLIALILLSTYGVLSTKIKIDKFDTRYLYLVILFIVYIVINTILTYGEIHEVDNYSRLLFLIPLFLYLKNSPTSKIDIILMCQACLIIAFFMFFFTHYPSDTRYSGTASSSITFGNIIMTLVIILIYQMLNERKPYLILANIIIVSLGFIVWSETLTRGSLAGLLISMLYIAFIYRSKIKIIILSLLVMISFILNSSISDRIYGTYKNISSVISFELKNSSIENRSENQRVAYMLYSFTQIKEKPFFGVGASNVKDPMRVYFRSNGFLVAESDHFHNEYLDIITKFGIVGFIIFVSIFLNMYSQIKKSKSIFYRDLSMLLILSQMGYMIFQSQFAHHQAIIFFLLFLNYCLSQCLKTLDNSG